MLWWLSRRFEDVESYTLLLRRTGAPAFHFIAMAYPASINAITPILAHDSDAHDADDLPVSSFTGREGSHGIDEYMNTKFIAFGGL